MLPNRSQIRVPARTGVSTSIGLTCLVKNRLQKFLCESNFKSLCEHHLNGNVKNERNQNKRAL